MEHDVCLGVEFLVEAQESLFAEPHRLFVGLPDSVLMFEGEDAHETFAEIVRSGHFCALDCKRALQEIYPVDSAEAALIDASEMHAARFFDIGLAAYLLNSNVTKYEYSSLCDAYLGAALPECEDERAQAATHALVAHRLTDALREALERDGSLEVYERIDLPLVSLTLAQMERVGARIDVDKLACMAQETTTELEGLRAEIYELAGEESNVDSPKQLGHILFEVLGPAGGRRRTQRGYSTDAKVLKELAEVHELPRSSCATASCAEDRSPTYIDALPRMRATDGRVHSSFNETVTTTGRLSSSDPNLQNIPVRTEFGRRVRACFVPLREGDVFVLGRLLADRASPARAPVG